MSGDEDSEGEVEGMGVAGGSDEEEPPAAESTESGTAET